jgi:hypothetical protein
MGEGWVAVFIVTTFAFAREEAKVGNAKGRKRMSEMSHASALFARRVCETEEWSTSSPEEAMGARLRGQFYRLSVGLFHGWTQWTSSQAAKMWLICICTFVCVKNVMKDTYFVVIELARETALTSLPEAPISGAFCTKT